MIISFFALYIMNGSLNTKFKKNNMDLFSFSSKKKKVIWIGDPKLDNNYKLI